MPIPKIKSNQSDFGMRAEKDQNNSTRLLRIQGIYNYIVLGRGYIMIVARIATPDDIEGIVALTDEIFRTSHGLRPSMGNQFLLADRIIFSKSAVLRQFNLQ